MDKLLAKYFQVFLYIGLVTGQAKPRIWGEDAGGKMGVQRRRVLPFLRFHARNVLGMLQVVGKEGTSGRHSF